MAAKTSGRVGEAGGWGAGSSQVMWYSSGFSGLCCTVMVAVASSSGVHRCGLWACGRGAVAASRCRMAGRMSKSSSQQWAGAHALSGEAGGGVLRSGVR